MTRQQTSAFTLIEVLIVVVILGVLAAIVIQQFFGASESTRQMTFVADVRTIASAEALYRNDHNAFLEDSGSGAIPTGFDPYIDTAKWLDGTPIGGVWDFELNSFGITSGFGVHFNGTGQTRDDAYMTEVDNIIDDGDLNTGGFRKIAGDRYYFIVRG